MSLFTKIMRRIIRILDGIVNLIALVLIVSAMLLSGYSLWDANQVYHAAEAAVYEAYIPTEEDTRSFDELRAINPEVMGWIRVNDTTINYPMVQAQDNSKYVNTDAEGKYSLSGAIFLNCQNQPDFTDFNNIIYGHHMARNKMFGDIGLFTDQVYFDSHPYGNLFFDGQDHGIEFFAMMTIDAYSDLFLVCEDTQEARQAYLNSVLEQARCVREIGVSWQDHLVLLTTCTTSITNGRNVLVGRLTDEIYPQAEAPRNMGTGVDRGNEGMDEIPIWMIVIAVMVLLLVALILFLKWKQRRNREGKA